MFFSLATTNSSEAFDIGNFAKDLAKGAAQVATESIVNEATSRGTYTSSNVQNEKELYPYGLVPFEEFVKHRARGKQPTPRDLKDYDRSYQKIATAAEKFKKDRFIKDEVHHDKIILSQVYKKIYILVDQKIVYGNCI